MLLFWKCEQRNSHEDIGKGKSFHPFSFCGQGSEEAAAEPHASPPVQESRQQLSQSSISSMQLHQVMWGSKGRSLLLEQRATRNYSP